MSVGLNAKEGCLCGAMGVEHIRERSKLVQRPWGGRRLGRFCRQRGGHHGWSIATRQEYGRMSGGDDPSGHMVRGL